MDEGQGSTILSENRSTRASSATLANNAYSSLSLSLSSIPLSDENRSRNRSLARWDAFFPRSIPPFSTIRRITFLTGYLYSVYSVYSFLLLSLDDRNRIRKRFLLSKFLKIDESFSSSFFRKHSFCLSTYLLSTKGIESNRIESRWNNSKTLKRVLIPPCTSVFSGIHLFAVNGLFAVHFLRHVRIMDYLRVSAGNVFLPPPSIYSITAI